MLKGIFPPLVTPLRSDRKVDQSGLERLIEHVLNGGVDGVFVLGTTGEGPGLDHEQRKEVVRCASRSVAGRVPVLVGITNSSYDESIRLSHFAAARGADAVVVAPQPYFGARPGELVDYLTRMAQDCPLPIFLYNIPAHTNVHIQWQTVERVSSIDGVIGYKDSSGDMVQLHKVRQVTAHSGNFPIMVGPEELLAESLLLGCDGGIPGGGNLFPRIYTRLYRACVDRRMDEVRRLHDLVVSISRLLYEIDESTVRVIRVVKGCLSRMGLCGDTLTFPFRSLDSDQASQLDRRLERMQIEVEAVLGAETGVGATLNDEAGGLEFDEETTIRRGDSE